MPLVLFPEVRTPACACLDCGIALDATMGVNARQPHPGAMVICAHCGHIQAFGAGLRLRPLTDPEMTEIAGNPTVVAIQKARAKVRGLRRSLSAGGGS